MSLKHTNVVVTGSDGFLGKRLVAALEARGVNVRGYDFTKGEDILNTKQVEDAIRSSNSTAVIHLAAVADLNIVAKDVKMGWKINVEGTRSVLSACKSTGARLLFASTCCAYGNNHCHPSSESSPLCPAEEYAQQKVESEHDVTAAGAPHTSLRLATFYGPGMRPALATAIFLDRARAGKDIVIHGSGTQTRTWTHVDDVVSGIVTVLQAEKYVPVVNISTDESNSVLDLARISCKVVGKEVAISHGEDRKGQVYEEQIDNSLLRSLGWKPKYNLFEGMKHSYESTLTSREDA
jgi:nucleoside-diphosphate-sugar epimerase